MYKLQLGLALNPNDVIEYYKRCHPLLLTRILAKGELPVQEAGKARSRPGHDSPEIKAIQLLLTLNQEGKLHMTDQVAALNLLRQGNNAYLRFLGEMMLACLSKNSVWMRRNLNLFLELNPEKVIFEMGAINNDKNLEEDLLQAVQFILRHIEYVELQSQFALMLSVLNELDSEDLSIYGNVRFPTLQALRAYIEKAKPMSIPFWFYVLISRATILEAHGFLEQHLDSILEPELLLWALSKLSLPSKYLKPKHLEVLAPIIAKPTHYQKLLLLRIYRHEGAKKEFEKIEPNAKLPIFHLQRKFYYEMLNDLETPTYPVHQLMRLNDFMIPNHAIEKTFL